MSKNRLSLWFDVYQELGESIGIHVFRQDRRDQSIHHTEQSHQKWDGFSLAVFELSALGWQIEAPRKLHSFSLSFISKVKAFFHYLYWARVRDVRWLKFDAQRMGCNSPQMHVLSQESSQQLISKLKNEQISLNSWVLYQLHQMSCPLFKNPVGTWWMPVDFRPFCDLDWSDGNVVSHIALDLTRDSTPREIEQDIHRRLMRGDHWAAWQWMQLIARMGKKVMRSILSAQLKKNRWCGTMTYMGEWPNRRSVAPQSMPYLFVGAPPAMKGHPISLGVSVMMGQICLGFCSHKALFTEDESIAFFKGLVNTLETSLGTSFPAPK